MEGKSKRNFLQLGEGLGYASQPPLQRTRKSVSFDGPSDLSSFSFADDEPPSPFSLATADSESQSQLLEEPPAPHLENGGFDKRLWNVPGDRYDLVRQLGHGSYGEVAEAYDKKKNRKVAIKRLPSIFDAALEAKRVYREMHILRKIRGCPEVIALLDVFLPHGRESKDLYLVFEFVETDLYKLIASPQFLTERHVQYLLYQILCGLKHIHSANVIHRDLKPANILLNEDCTLKICDFGLARVVSPESIMISSTGSPMASEDVPIESSSVGIPARPSGPITRQDSEASILALFGGGAQLSKPHPLRRQLTKHVVTRWYRAPELILLQDYTSAVDLWSVGCIFAELLSMLKENCPAAEQRTPLFPGSTCFPLSEDAAETHEDRQDQLNVIFNVIGSPSEDDLQELDAEKAQQYLKSIQPVQPRPLSRDFPGASGTSINLLECLLRFRPKNRATVDEALNHPFLSEMPKFDQQPPHKLSMDLEDLMDESIQTKMLKDLILFEERHYQDLGSVLGETQPAITDPIDPTT